MKKIKFILSGLFCGILLIVGGCATAPQEADRVQLKLFFNGHDYYVTASGDGETEAEQQGYQFVRIEGEVFARPGPGLVALKQYWSGPRSSHLLLGHALPKTLVKNDDYKLVRIEGYAYAQPHSGTVPLKRFIRQYRNFTTATPEGEKQALAARFKLRRIEAYVFPEPQNATNAVEIQVMNTDTGIENPPVTTADIQKWIGLLHDPDYGKRKAAVNMLAHHPNESLPALNQALSAATDDDQRWWIQSAIQECQKQQ